jgi:uncharacterized protein
MYREQGRLLFSPSDLSSYMESPFSTWMARLSIEDPEHCPEKDPDDPLMQTLAQKGYAHEDALETQLRNEGLKVLKIESDSKEAAHAETLSAMADGVDVIVQGYLKSEQFAGYSDFLVKVTGKSLLGDFHYEVWDTKLATKVKPKFLIQLSCYAEMLEQVQGVKPEYLTVVLGNGQRERFRTQDYYHYYRSLKSSFLAQQAQFSIDNQPDPADYSSWGNWSQYVEKLLTEKDHLFQVANITKGQIKKLNQAGIYTLTELAQCQLSHIPGMNPDILERLKAQAAIQLKTRINTKQTESDIPCFEIIKPIDAAIKGLALLPPSSPLDVYFDIEGYPLAEGGLEYLWGATYFDPEGHRQFKDFWAHNAEQEKRAFTAFIQWVYARWQADKHMHIYHYASYEITACRKLMGRYGVCEHEVDELLRNEVFVDLYQIVRTGILIGEPRYSIKNVEHLYRGKRETEVGTGGDSVVVYERWQELNAKGEEGDTWETSGILKSIRDYNIDDCNSTQELVDWLRHQQNLHNITYTGKQDADQQTLSEEVTEKIRLRDSLLVRAERESPVDERQAAMTENLAWFLEFHRREVKPLFWRLFDRLSQTEIELFDELDCLVGCKRSARAPFLPSPNARNHCYEYHFDPTQEFKGAALAFYILGHETEDGKALKASYVENESDIENGIITLQHKNTLPEVVTLIPDEFVPPGQIPGAIEDVVKRYADGELDSKKSAILDFLRRDKPRFSQSYSPANDSGAIAPSTDPEIRLQQVINATNALDNSYLTIQGPPGSGKSYTAKHLIAQLLEQGASVGIASNSHKAINHLLLNTAKHCRENGISATFTCTKETDAELEELDVSVVKNNDLHNHTGPACVVGATAWGFAREEMIDELDYLFVDEAGQVAVANLIAMSRATKNIILMGDQMQLGQPSEGSHPKESGLSSLDYLMHEVATIPDDMGVFLGTTFRMHSKVNHFISEHIYEGKLTSSPNNDKRLIKVPENYKGPLNVEAGIVYVPVQHEGNTQASDEEVEQITLLVHDLLGRDFHTGNDDEPIRKIGWSDILFVAPYNHQVSKLKKALGEYTRVGSVDKFQGQEAPIVILSMCASDPTESPRGMDFLFDRNRLNVAISRAQTLAIVVANPGIASAPVGHVKQMNQLNLFNALIAANASGAISEHDETYAQAEI